MLHKLFSSLRYKFLLMVGFIFISGMADAATPFTISGNKINAIFNDEAVWKKVFRPVEKIEFLSHDEQSQESVYKFSTATCEFEVAVENVASKFNPIWKVKEAKIPAGC